MTQPPSDDEPQPNGEQRLPHGSAADSQEQPLALSMPDSDPVGAQPRRGRTTAGIVIAAFAALVIIAGIAGAIVLIGNSHIDVTSDDDAPTAPIVTNDFDLPTDFPSYLTDLPSAITELPTAAAPTEEQYVNVARAVVKAVAKGDCDKALTYFDPDYGEAAGEFGLCEVATKQAAADDDTDTYAIQSFGTFGAAVSFDNGQTYISMVAQPDGEPTVEFFLAY